MTMRWILLLIVGLSVSGYVFFGVGLKKSGIVNNTTYPVSETIRSLNKPPPENFVTPGIQGLYAELRKDTAWGKKGICGLKSNSRPSGTQLAPYTRYQSPDTPANPVAFNIRQIVIKFVEGTAMRLRDGQLQQVKETDAVEMRERLTRAGLESDEVQRDLTAFNKALKSMQAVIGRAAPQIEEQDLSLLRRCAENRARREMPDLNLFYFVHLPKSGGKTAQKLLNQLRKLRIVELAYFQPIPFDAADIPPLTTINVTPSQNYFRPAPTGIDVDFARHFQSGRGNTVRIADIEAGWHLDHEDLPRSSFGFGVNWVDSHGTSVLGQIAAEENGFGANGIAPNAMIGWSSVTNLDIFRGGIYFYSVGNALLMSGLAIRVGDIALIEQQFQHGNVGFICNPATDPCHNCSAPHWVAVEEFAYEHAVISTATAVGVIVVEAAGNGRMRVTPASNVDSGAIVVGASDRTLHPTCWSNFGSRVNVHGWGMGIGTTGWGGAPYDVPDPNLRANDADANQWYTNDFGGTSGASPIVVGAAAIIQSMRTEVGLPMLNSFDMRSLLAATGTPQEAGTTPNIGPLPDLRRAIASFRPDAAQFVSQTSAPSNLAPRAIFTQSVTFSNIGGVAWSGTHTMSVARSFQTGLQEFQAPTFSLGASVSEIFPGDQVTRIFSITAPSQPGTYNLGLVLKNGSDQLLASSPTQQIVIAVPNTQFDNAIMRIDRAPGSLRDGQHDTITVTATNIGTTTWTPTYLLRLSRGLRISLPEFNKPVIGRVSPGQSQTYSFEVICNGRGQGFFSAQMAGRGTIFGQIATRTVLCQP